MLNRGSGMSKSSEEMLKEIKKIEPKNGSMHN
jgi:hypothetical protein